MAGSLGVGLALSQPAAEPTATPAPVGGQLVGAEPMDLVHIALSALGGIIVVALVAIGVAARADAINRALDRPVNSALDRRDLP